MQWNAAKVVKDTGNVGHKLTAVLKIWYSTRMNSHNCDQQRSPSTERITPLLRTFLEFGVFFVFVFFANDFRQAGMYDFSLSPGAFLSTLRNDNCFDMILF